MDEKDKTIIARSIALGMPISKYETIDAWYDDFKKNIRKLMKQKRKEAVNVKAKSKTKGAVKHYK